jgi:hypothetical protein
MSQWAVQRRCERTLFWGNYGWEIGVARGRGDAISLTKPFSDPGWVAAAIEHGVNQHVLVLDTVVNGKWKPL